MTFNFGLNTGIGFGTGFTGYNTGYQTSSIDYAKLNQYTNSIMSQLNTMNYSQLGQYSLTNSMPTWFNNIASCFTVDPLVTGAYQMPSMNNPFGSVASLAQQYNQSAQQAQAPQQTPEQKAEADKKKAEEKAKTEKAQKEANEICEKLYVAMKGAGTDNKAVDEALAQITEDNILEVMETYIQQYSDDMDGETLIESLQNEYWFGWSGKLTKITNGLKDKLAARASKMGLDAEAKSFKAKVTSENNSWWNIDDEVINNHFNTLLAAMLTKRAQG